MANSGSTSPLRAMRRASGISMADFAAACGIDAATLYAVEVGARRIPATMRQGLAAMGVDTPRLSAAQDEWAQRRVPGLRAAVGDQVRAAAVTVLGEQ